MTSSKVQSATSYHSDIATDFDDRYRTSLDFKERFVVWSKFLTEYIETGARVLDAGCGSGIFSFYLNQKGAKVTGIDGAAGMIEFCKKKKEEDGLSDIVFKQERLPLKTSDLGHYDTIIASSVLEYVQDLDATIDGFHQLLIEDGTLILSLPNRESLYRKIEKLFFTLTKKPVYLRHTQNIYSLLDTNNKVQSKGFAFVRHEYYAANYPGGAILKGILGERYSSNLFIAVYRKI